MWNILFFYFFKTIPICFKKAAISGVTIKDLILLTKLAIRVKETSSFFSSQTISLFGLNIPEKNFKKKVPK